MRRTKLWFLGIVLGVGVLGCAGWPSATSGSGIERILASGQLRVATAADLPPLAHTDRNGEVVGFEIDLVRALARAMKLDLVLVVVPFPELLDTLEARDADLVISGLTMTPERNARVAFAGPYFVSGTSLVSRDPELADAASPEALHGEGKRFAALAGSTSAEFVRSRLPGATLVEVEDYEAGTTQLLADEVDALVADFLACKLAVWRNPDAGLRMARVPFTTEPLGIAVPPDQPLLLNLVQNHLRTLETTGELTMLKARWLARGSWVEELP